MHPIGVGIRRAFGIGKYKACLAGSIFAISNFFVGEAIALQQVINQARGFRAADEHLLHGIAAAASFDDLFSVDTLRLDIPEHHLLGAITDFCFMPDGRILVGDRDYAKSVLLLDASGRFITKVGASGAGPGEYQNPMNLRSTSDYYIILSDFMRPGVTVYDSQGAFASFINTGFMAANVVPVERDRVLVRRGDGVLLAHPIELYSFSGRKLATFGRRSKLVEMLLQKLALVWIENLILCQDGFVYEMDYVDYRIRKYTIAGALVGEFGEKPAEWRSVAELDFSPVENAGPELPGRGPRSQFINNQIAKCSRAYWMHFLAPDVIAVLFWNGRKSGFKNAFFYHIYNTDGRLLRGDLPLHFRFDVSEERARSIELSYPAKLVGIDQFHDSAAKDHDFLIYDFRLKAKP